MRHFIWPAVVCAAAVLASCEDSPPTRADLAGADLAGAEAPDMSAEADLSAAVDLGPTPDLAGMNLTPCLDRPEALDVPPTGGLPCELLPPNF